MTKVWRMRTEKVNSARPTLTPTPPSPPWDLDAVLQGKPVKSDGASDPIRGRWFHAWNHWLFRKTKYKIQCQSMFLTLNCSYFRCASSGANPGSVHLARQRVRRGRRLLRLPDSVATAAKEDNLAVRRESFIVCSKYGGLNEYLGQKVAMQRNSKIEQCNPLLSMPDGILTKGILPFFSLPCTEQSCGKVSE